MNPLIGQDVSIGETKGQALFDKGKSISCQSKFYIKLDSINKVFARTQRLLERMRH